MAMRTLSHLKRLELIQKDMIQEEGEGFAGWIRTTWLPLTERIPEHDRNLFVSEMIDTYLMKFPMDKEGLVHTRMLRLGGGSGQALSMAGTSVIDQQKGDGLRIAGTSFLHSTMMRG